KSTRDGFTIDLQLELSELKPGTILLDAYDRWGKGWALRLNDNKNIVFELSDGRTKSTWSCDPDIITPHKQHHVTVIVDGGPRIISFVIDGLFNDGGDDRQFGWGRFNPYLLSAKGNTTLEIAPEVKSLKLYNRAITVTESIGNYKKGT